MMEERQWNPEELQALALLGLSITPHSDPARGWGYTWQDRDWTGPFTTIDAAIHAAFTEASQALLFRSEHSWVPLAQSGEVWRFEGEAGWREIKSGRQVKPRVDIEAADVEEQARQDWSNDE